MVTMLKWKLDLVDLEIVLVLTQDRCMVSRQTYQRLRIDLNEPDGTPW